MDDAAPTNQQGFAGQQQLTDDTSAFNVQWSTIWRALGLVRTIQPVLVKAVHVDGEGVDAVITVDVQPMVKMVDGLGNATAHGVVNGLPVFRLQGGAGAVLMTPAVGDIGIAGFADRDISAVKSTRAVANPGSKRRFDFADGIYFGGMLNGAPDRYILFDDDGITMADQSGNKMQMTAAGFVVTTAPGGDFIVNGISVTTHVHPVTTAPGTTGPPA